MKILIEICHPAHVHYFRNMIRILKSEGHDILIAAQDRGIIKELLTHYKLEFFLFKNSSKNIFGKFLHIINSDMVIYKHARKFKPDILIGFAGTYISHVGWIINKPRIVVDDTEHANLTHFTYKYFASNILTPSCFHKNFGRKQIRFNSYIELAYLYPKYFKPDFNILNELNIDKTKKNILIRFVSWRASHDIGQSGLSFEAKIKLVETLSTHANIIISSEEKLPVELIKFQYRFKPERMHDILASVDLFIGEGATMASECAILGTPAIYINSLELGYTTEQEEKYGLVYNFRNADGVLQKALSLIKIPNLKNNYLEGKTKLLQDKIDITTFLVWFLKNYPESSTIMEKNPESQDVFK